MARTRRSAERSSAHRVAVVAVSTEHPSPSLEATVARRPVWRENFPYLLKAAAPPPRGGAASCARVSSLRYGHGAPMPHHRVTEAGPLQYEGTGLRGASQSESEELLISIASTSEDATRRRTT